MCTGTFRSTGVLLSAFGFLWGEMLCVGVEFGQHISSECRVTISQTWMQLAWQQEETNSAVCCAAESATMMCRLCSTIAPLGTAEQHACVCLRLLTLQHTPPMHTCTPGHSGSMSAAATVMVQSNTLHTTWITVRVTAFSKVEDSHGSTPWTC
jgi:hypothetical protein